MTERRGSIVWEAMLEDLRQVVREEIRATLGTGGIVKASTDSASPYLTIKEAAEMSRLAPSTIRLLIRKRQLRVYKVGRRVIIKMDELDRFLTGIPIEPIRS